VVEAMEEDAADVDSTDEGPREFRFSIADDANLQELVERRESTSSLTTTGSLGHGHTFQDPTTGAQVHGANGNGLQRANGNLHGNGGRNGGSLSLGHISGSGSGYGDGMELSSEYILSKLYNYMKISEMSKYGIQVFEMTFSSYLPFLSEADLFRLATSYWCNGAHFNCMTAHRGDRIKNTPNGSGAHSNGNVATSFVSSVASIARVSMFGDGGSAEGNEAQRARKESVLCLEITDELLDAAMQSGASVDKIEAMLLQKREDDGLAASMMPNGNLAASSRRGRPQRWRCRKDGKLWFFQTKEERAFYLRNLKHRFWNHEVLVRVFIQNGWLTPDLAEYAMKTFIKTIYHRVLQSKAPRPKNGGGVKLSETFLQSFFAEHFCLDDIPKMYREDIRRRRERGGKCGAATQSHHLSEETLRRWCELIELLASRGAAVHCSEFGKMIPLQYALQIGRNTFKIISSSHKAKNKLFIPEQWNHSNITVPDDIWDVLVSYL